MGVLSERLFLGAGGLGVVYLGSFNEAAMLRATVLADL